MQLPSVSLVSSASFVSSGLGSSRSFIVLSSLHAAVLASSLLTSPAGADPFDAPGHPIASGVTWASQVEILVRGPLDIANPGLGNASSGDAANTLGPAAATSTDTVSLGDGGSITLSFDLPLANGVGDDIAVYENGFLSVDGLFAELAFVEVSSDGAAFARFDSATLSTTQVPAFGTLDPTQYAGLAGDQPAGLGTGFDLDDLAGHALVMAGTLDLDHVRYVRVVDVVGDGSTSDSGGSPIYDPYATAFAAGGFDLDGVAGLQAPAVPIGPAVWLAAFVLLGLAGRRELSRPGGQAMPGGVRALVAGLGALGLASPAAALTASFDDVAATLGLGAKSFYNGSDLAGGFTSGGALFVNDYNPSFSSWQGFSVSNTTDATTPGFGNQYSAIPGGGALGTDAYGVSFAFEPSSVFFDSPVDLDGAWLTNTTYAFLTLRDGDAFTDPFGGPTGDEPDVFTLTLEGFDDGFSSVGIVEFILADYTSPPPDNSGDTIVDTWSLVDLSSLQNVSELRFSLDSTDVGSFGSNTPAYFGIDELTFASVPEPGSGLLLTAGLLMLARRTRPTAGRRTRPMARA